MKICGRHIDVKMEFSQPYVGQDKLLKFQITCNTLESEIHLPLFLSQKKLTMRYVFLTGCVTITIPYNYFFDM